MILFAYKEFLSLDRDTAIGVRSAGDASEARILDVLWSDASKGLSFEAITKSLVVASGIVEVVCPGEVIEL
jgi:hypothetical protein